MTHFSEQFLSKLAGALYDGIVRRDLKEGFTVGDIVRSGLPMIDNAMLASIALQRLIGDGIIRVRIEEDGNTKEMKYYLKNGVPCQCESAEKEPKMQYNTKEMRAKTHQQVGGTHYVDMAIQPVDYITKNGLGFLEGSVVKYVSRWKAKNGIEDLKKARHCLDMLIEEVDEAN